MRRKAVREMVTDKLSHTLQDLAAHEGNMNGEARGVFCSCEHSMSQVGRLRDKRDYLQSLIDWVDCVQEVAK